MNTDSGASDYSTYRIQYSYALQQLDLISARVHKPDGRTVLAENGGETGYSDAAISMYYDTRQRVLRFRTSPKATCSISEIPASLRRRTLTRTAATTAGSSRFNHRCRKSFVTF